MKRREFLTGTACLVTAGKLLGNRIFGPISRQSSSQPGERAGLPSTVAGICIVDSQIARQATELGRRVYPPHLFNHALRTFVFGALIGRAGGLKFDDEILYVACLLHDLGLTQQFQGELPFEIQGAEAARHFLDEQNYPKEKAALVWDGIAMHASLIGHFKASEIRLVGEGAGADVAGPEPSEISRAQTDEVLKSFPRLQFKTAFLKTCADVVRKYPGSATRSFMRDIGTRYVPEFQPRNICDVVLQAPFAE